MNNLYFIKKTHHNYLISKKLRKIKWKLKINLLKDIFRQIPKLNFLIEIKKKLT